MTPPWRVASRVLPMRDDEPCGDAAGSFVWGSPAGDAVPTGLLAIVDGLGHGPEAANAARAAIGLLADAPDLALAELLMRLDAGLAQTRGAAVGLVRLDGNRLQHAGIGNTRALHLRGDVATRLPSQNGIVGGGRTLSIAVNTLALQPGDWLLLFTDGLNERVHLPVQLPEWRRDPGTLCQHLLTQWRVGHDDAGVLALFVDAA